MGSFGTVTDFGHGFKAQFLFDPKYTNLNHGMSSTLQHLGALSASETGSTGGLGVHLVGTTEASSHSKCTKETQLTYNL